MLKRCESDTKQHNFYTYLKAAWLHVDVIFLCMFFFLKGTSVHIPPFFISWRYFKSTFFTKQYVLSLTEHCGYYVPHVCLCYVFLFLVFIFWWFPWMQAAAGSCFLTSVTSYKWKIVLLKQKNCPFYCSVLKWQYVLMAHLHVIIWEKKYFTKVFHTWIKNCIKILDTPTYMVCLFDLRRKTLQVRSPF